VIRSVKVDVGADLLVTTYVDQPAGLTPPIRMPNRFRSHDFRRSSATWLAPHIPGRRNLVLRGRVDVLSGRQGIVVALATRSPMASSPR